jgi:dolichol-phosphate mannosyltransferase
LIVGHPQHVAEVPYSFAVREKGESKLNARQQVDYLKHLWSLMKRTGEVWRFIKFIIVGGTGVGVNLGSYWLLTRFADLSRPAALAISFEASVISNFLLNNFFTFADRRESKAGAFLLQLVKFNTISLAGLGIQEGCLWILNTALHVNDIIAVLVGIILATLWNYFVNNRWTWK